MAVGSTITLLGLTIWNLTILIPYLMEQRYAIGVDYRFFVEAAQRWLDGAPIYHPHQVSGPYQISLGHDFLYPPTALWLFVPFIWLPAILWWVVPVALIAGSLWRLRPAWWTWPFLALVLWYPRTEAMFFFGNTTLWVVAFLFVGGWVAPLALFKPSLAIFSLVGLRQRAWWIGLGLFAGLSAPLIGLWPDYVRATVNSGGGILYGAIDFPIVCAPLIAWAGRRGAIRTHPSESS